MLGRHVAGRSTLLKEADPARHHEPQVNELRGGVPGEKDIVRAHVAMHQPAVVDNRKPPAQGLCDFGGDLAEVTGWGSSFVGSLFLAATTSLPELVVAIVALRLGAIDMAIANMLGSNMFNMGIVIAGYDLFYRQGSIFSASPISDSHVYAASMAILMTLIVIAGLTFRTKRKLPIGMSWYSAALIVAYLAGAYILFTTGVPAG